ncbi:hypothetical protein [Alloactinosynnema sp. L-07]|nr:hypothetical protein [Alloactinosynnema sp. L-07]
MDPGCDFGDHAGDLVIRDRDLHVSPLMKRRQTPAALGVFLAILARS